MRNNDDNRDGNFLNIFSGLDKFINIVSDMVENEKDEVKINGTFKPDEEKKITGKYGFDIKLGVNGAEKKARIKSLDEIFDKKDNTPKSIEPVTDVFEDDEKVTIVIELPGVTKDDISLSLDGNTVTLNASGNSTCYVKKIVLKFAPDYNAIKENFTNSIFSVVIKKKNDNA
jgi:HSP20 family protein